LTSEEAIIKIVVRQRKYHPLAHDVHRAVRNIEAYARLYDMDVEVVVDDDD
jgi:hypothetical protein